MHTQQSVLEKTIVCFYQKFISGKEEFKDVSIGNVKEFISNVITFAKTHNGVGNAGEDKWTTFCAEQKLSGNLYSFTNASRLSSFYNQIAKKREIPNKRLHQFSGEPVYLETFHMVNLVDAISAFANATKPRYGAGAPLSAAADGVTDVFGSPVIHQAGEAVFSGAEDAVTGAAELVKGSVSGGNATKATEVLGQAGNAATDVAPVDVAEVELAEATEGLVGSGIKTVSEVLQRGGDAMTSIGNKTVELGGNGINTLSEMTPTVPEVMQRGGDVTSAGNQAAELGRDTINSDASCCEDTSWVAACCENTGSCIVETGSWVAACCENTGSSIGGIIGAALSSL